MKNLIQRNAAFIAAVLLLSMLISCERESVSPDPNVAEGSSSGMRQSNITAPVGCGNSNLAQHFISIDYAYSMIRNYQSASKKRGEICSIFDKGGWVLAETFPAEVIQKVISQQGCCKFRIYNGLDKDNREHMVMVGVNEFGVDILSATGRAREGKSMAPDSTVNVENLDIIIEMGNPCPESCPGVYVGP